MLENIRRKVHHDGLDEFNMPPLPVFFLPGTFLFLSGSPFETTLHDGAYGAFMTPPLYTSTREDQETQNQTDGSISDWVNRRRG
jgi:hypothetical protein